MENNQSAAPVSQNPTPPSVGQATEDNKPLIGLILGIVGFIFALPQVKWLSVLVILMLIASLILGFISLKPGKKGKAIAAIILSILGLLMAIMAFSGKKAVNKAEQTTTVTENANLPNVFKDATLGYSINYPQNWTTEKSDNFSLILRGAKGTPDYETRVAIQNIAFKSRGGSYNSVDEGIGSFKAQIKEMDKNAKITDSNKTSFAIGNMTLSGRAFEAEYKLDGKKVKQVVSLLAYPEEEIYIMFGFGCPEKQFEAASEIVVEMFNSVVLSGN